MLYLLVIGVLFLLCAVEDFKRKSLRSGLLLAGVGVIFLVFGGELGYPLLSQKIEPVWKEGIESFLFLQLGIGQRLLGAGVGGILLVISFLSRGKIGLGDGYLLCISGFALGVQQNLALLGYGLLFAGVVAVVMLICKKASRNTKMPFVPFLFGAYLLCLVQGGL